MQIVLIGINHKTAPVDIRQRLAFDTQQVYQTLLKLRETYPACEFTLLSTCNRVECYAVVDKTTGPSPMELGKWLTGSRSVDFESIKEHFYFKTDEDAVTHLFAVASSLDSMVIGESQITFQVKESYKLASHCKTTGKILNHLFHDAFRTTKEIVTRTSIANRRVSVAGVAVEQAKRLFSGIQSASVVVAGAGQMAELLVEHFRHENCRDVTVVNRSRQRGCQLAEKHEVSNKPWEKLDRQMCRADIVVGAVSATEGYLFDANRIDSLMTRRQHRPLLIIDIAVPRTFDPSVGRLDNVHLYNIDDLAQVAQDNIKLRQGDLERAIEIVCKSVASFMDWFMMRDVGPLIGQIRDAFEQIYELEMEKLEDGMESYHQKTTDSSASNVTNKLSHRVVRNIDILSKEHGVEEAQKFAQNILTSARKIISMQKNEKNAQS